MNEGEEDLEWSFSRGMGRPVSAGWQQNTFFFLTSGYNEGVAWTWDLEPLLERLAERERVLKPPLESSEADGKCFCAVSDVGESEDTGSLLASPPKGKKSGLVTGTLC